MTTEFKEYDETCFPMTVEFFEHNNDIVVWKTLEDYKSNKRSFKVIKAHWKTER